MKNLFLITAALFLGSLHCFADGGSYSAVWQRGNTFYEQKQYDSAASCYEQIAALKPLNAELYYNLGNAYYRLNKVGFAVLNYERALKINPDYKEAKDNLLLAQGRISNNINPIGDIFFIRWWNAITMPGTATAWSVAALITFLLFIGLLLVVRLRKTHIPAQLQGILVLLLLCFLSLAFFSSKNSTQKTDAVIMEGDAPLMNRELKGKPLMLVPEGTIVKIEDEQNGWVLVKLPNGREGWLQQNLVSRV